MTKFYNLLLLVSFPFATSNVFGQDWMPFQPQVRYTYSYLKDGKKFYSSNKSSSIQINAKGKWVSFQNTFPVNANQNYLRYPWIEFDSSQCPLNSAGLRPSPVSIALPSSIWGSTAGITSDGWARIYFFSYLKPIDSVQFNIHAAINQNFVYKPSTGATARITQKSWMDLITQVSDSTIKFETSDNHTFWLSKRNGFFMLPSLGATSSGWTPVNLQMAATQGLPGVNYYKKKTKDLITWKAGDTIGYNYKYRTLGSYLHYEYWIRYSVLQRQEIDNGESIRLIVQKAMLRKTYNTPYSLAQPDYFYPPKTDTVVIGYPAWADTIGITHSPVTNGGGFDGGLGGIEPDPSFIQMVLGSGSYYSNSVDHQPVEERDGKLVFSFSTGSMLLDSCPALIRHNDLIIDGGGWAGSSFSEGFGHIFTEYTSVMGFGTKLELDCYKMNGAGKPCIPLLILATESEIKQEPLKIFPNPGINAIRISGESWKNIRIGDVQGRQLLIVENDLQKEAVDVKALPSGLYFVSITGLNGQVQQIKWLKE